MLTTSLLHSVHHALKPWICLTRIDRLAGSMLIIWPFLWSFTLCAKMENLSLRTFVPVLVYGSIGCAVLHSAGCIWNDILDRDFDRLVERTKNRPIASGQISVKKALCFLSVHLLFLVVIIWPCNSPAWELGLTGIFALPGLYPLMKRVTYWPQAFLGVAMNLIVLVTSATYQGAPAPFSFALVACCWCWTMYYDTVYACQDKCDDVNAGVKSTALLFGSRVKLFLSGFAVLFVCGLYCVGVLSAAGMPFFVLSIGGAALHFAFQISQLDVDDVKSCLITFEANAFTLGSIVWTGVLVDYLHSILVA
ncbi:4-hydroxybenzoate polyprenyl transferase [Gymnopus androsaceus JB14]|uniref:4-hydroxybenzoate polyprenyltransferase, mitochondrial n=1 Tax=Gymnopus androsaceus JB14 TaxID=1447944 RepID=A0A6A4I3C0_9AGAR|nr:4-hydroxybenzoate polyprenyl transferase [Gymnopus androsaceus JB14]